MTDRKIAIYGVMEDPSSVLSVVGQFLSSSEYGDYLVITRARDGDIYVQNSHFVKGFEEAEEAVKSGEISQETIEEIERISKELSLEQPVIESINIVRYKSRKL